MKKLTLFLITIFIYQLCLSQSMLERGATPSELYVVSYWKSLDYMLADLGLFYSEDHGKTITVKYTQSLQNPDTLFVRRIVAGAKPGVLYNRFGFNNYFLHFSEDFGQSWTPLVPYQGLPSSMTYLAGVKEGELYRIDTTLQISHDYGQTFTVLSDQIDFFNHWKIGCKQGQLFGANIYYEDNSIDLFEMTEYSGHFTYKSTIDSTQCKSITAFFSRGANAGELYYVDLYPVGSLQWRYDIYFSRDDGLNFEYRYTSGIFNWDAYDLYFTGGRSDGSFYVSKSRMDYPTSTWLLEINYSRDSALTFETYTHYLDETVMQQEIKVPSINASASPNPFSNTTRIDFTLEQRQDLSIHISDLNGSLVRELFSGSKEKGQHEIIWDGKNSSGKDQPKGIYFIQVQSKNSNKTLKVLKM
jgi:FlgD Ig-like domain